VLLKELARDELKAVQMQQRARADQPRLRGERHVHRPTARPTALQHLDERPPPRRVGELRTEPRHVEQREKLSEAPGLVHDALV